MQIDSSVLARRTAVLDEMGVGPLWVRRDALIDSAVDAPPALAESESAPPAAVPQQQSAKAAPAAKSAAPDKSTRTGDDAAWDDSALPSGAAPIKTVLTLCSPLDVNNTVRYLFAARASSAQGSEELFANILLALGLRKETSAQGDLAGLSAQMMQLRAQRPAALIAMGPAIALELTGGSAAAGDENARFESLRGRLHRNGDLPLLVTYDAAHLLRRPADKRGAWDDLCLLMQHLKRPQTADAADPE